MDKDTREFIEKQNDKMFGAIDKFRDSVDTKLTGIQTTIAAQNLKLGQGSERFKSIDARFKDNTNWHRVLLTLIFLILSGLLAIKAL